MPLRELAFTQLCQKLSAPAPYLRRLPEKLQLACLNFAMTRERRPLLLRAAGGELRAVLSDRYAPLDHTTMMEMTADVLDRAGYADDVRVRAIATGAHTVVRITLPGEGRAVRVGDVIEHGIDIANSELGLRSVQLTPLTYRLVCANGMRAWRSAASLRLRHVGDPSRLRRSLADAIPVAFAEARGDLDRWAMATEVLIDDAWQEVQRLRRFGVGVGDVRSIATELLGGGDHTAREAMTSSAFDVANAITAVARRRADGASRLELEEVGHRYLVSVSS